VEGEGNAGQTVVARSKLNLDEEEASLIVKRAERTLRDRLQSKG